MTNRHSRTAVLVFAASVLVSACVTTPATGDGSAASLMGKGWVVEDVAGRGVIDDTRPSLAFGQDGRLSGNGGCNRIIGTYVVNGARLTLGPPGLTRMSCPPAIMEQERRLVDVLGAVRTYRIDDTGALILTAGAGATITAR